MRLILVRHGQTTSNLGGLLDTDEPGADLTALGRNQAAALPQALAGHQIAALYASTLVRTQQTAAPLAAARSMEVQVRPGVREVSAGSMEMLGDEVSVRTYLETVLAWSDGDLDLRMPGGENGHEVYGRFDAVVDEAAAAVDGGGAALVVSHGAVIRSWTAARATNVTTLHAARNALANTGVVVLAGSPTDGWTVLTWGGHPVGDPVDPHGDGPAGEPLWRTGEPARSPRD